MHKLRVSNNKESGEMGESVEKYGEKWGKGKQVEPFRAISLGSQ